MTIPDNYFADEVLLKPQKFVNPFELPKVSSGNLISPQTIAFIDRNIDDAATVMANLRSDVKILLDPSRDGIAQITEALKNYRGLSSIDIISHGNISQVQLGNSSLSANSLQHYANDLQQWKSALAPEADILFYGCNIADGQSGQAFVNEISNLTGADVAASINTTGNAAKGGDWTLEYATGTIEADLSLTDAVRNSYQGVLPSLFTTQTPTVVNATDGTGSAGDYELGMEFQSAKSGTIDAIRYYKAASETGTHTGRIWLASTGQELASITFTNETASGWQQQTLATPLNITAGTTYLVSVNANTHYVATSNGIAATITNGDLSAVADGSNGVFNPNPSAFPTQSFNNANYFRDIVFTAANAPTPNSSISLSGTPTQNQTLSASITDPNGLAGVIPTYQWQQSTNGTTWNNVNGATTATFTLNQAQVGSQVRVTASYTDPVGSSENPMSTPSTAVVNVNDPGTVAINGTTALGQTLTANINDADGLAGVTPTYQWQQLSNNTWSNISGATVASFTLAAAQVGSQVRVNAIYTDALNGSENITSSPSSTITAAATTQSIFAATATPTVVNATDGSGSAGD
uniref:DUF4347 domain-containing protein n=2 Tax=unclassified Chamaesiphon TaxID=2620921 RepID=UPI00286BA88E